MMPLRELDALTAWDNVFSRKGISRWPGGEGRFMPFASPEFEPSFKIAAKSKIFSIGSCFARNIEKELDEHGFDVVSRRYYGDSGIVNKYNSFSMLDEVRWAAHLKPPLHIADRVFRVGEDAFFDMHLHHTSPMTMSECISHTALAGEMYGEIVDCPYFIITLGLAEVWYDRQTDTYLNEPANIIKYYRKNEEVRDLFQKRFIFRILNHAEAYTSTFELIAALRIVSPHCKIILTVSPVPLSSTFSGQEVLSANMYSKSLLRVVAEEVCLRFEGVDYFPSYESVMLSPRHSTWCDDNLHITGEVVAHNVQRMLARYV